MHCMHAVTAGVQESMAKDMASDIPPPVPPRTYKDKGKSVPLSQTSSHTGRRWELPRL